MFLGGLKYVSKCGCAGRRRGSFVPMSRVCSGEGLARSRDYIIFSSTRALCSDVSVFTFLASRGAVMSGCRGV